MTREEFQGWLTDPVTKWVFAGMQKASEANRDEWIRQSWDAGAANPENLADLRTSAMVMDEIRLNEFEHWQNWNGESDD